MSSRSKSTPQVHQIKAIFEGFRHGRIRPRTPSREPSHHSNMSTDNLVSVSEQPAALHPHSQDHGSSHLADQAHPRPALSAKPSWIGPVPREHSKHTMTRRITITYAAPGLRAPVFITTSLSDPAWDILEMSATKTPYGELLFHIDFDVADGEYQYKFRLGPGDWWVCDDSKPTIDDGLGNRNNLLYVGAEPHWQDLEKVDSARSHDHTLKVGELSRLPDHRQPVDTPGMREATASEVDTLSTRSDEVDLSAVSDPAISVPTVISSNIDEEVSTAEDEERAPLLAHEATLPLPQTEMIEDMLKTSPAKSDSSNSSFEDTFYPEADASDPTLHPFPTHEEGILNEIRRAHRVLPEDQPDDAPSPQPKHIAFKGTPIAVVPEDAESDDAPQQIRSRAPTGLSRSAMNGDKWYNHSHGPAHHPAHEHKQLLEEEKEEQKKVLVDPSGIVEPAQTRSALDGMRDALLGLGLAIMVAIIALLLFKSGLFVAHDAVKDGGSTLGG